MARTNIQQRVEQIQAKAAKRNEVTLQKLVEMGIETYEMAKSQKYAGQMAQALMVLARITGHDKQKIEVKDRVININYVAPRDIEGECEEVGDAE
jgi:hypothetical protein